MNRKLTIVLIFFAFSLIFSACLPRGNRGIYDDSSMNASDRLEQIIGRDSAHKYFRVQLSISVLTA